MDDDEDPEEEEEDRELVASKAMASGGLVSSLVSWLAWPISLCARLFCNRMFSTPNSLAFLIENDVCFLDFLL